MKRTIRNILSGLAILILILLVLNIKVTTKQGVNYQLRTIRIPLYLKILDFFDRHYNYEILVKRILSRAESDREKVLRLFAWTHENIKKSPPGLPVIDDHVWHIIIRGYGEPDQITDVFTTLCNYSGINAFFSKVGEKEKKSGIPFSFVKIDNRWSVFDPAGGSYFKNNSGLICSVEEILEGNWQTVNIQKNLNNQDYIKYFNHLESIQSRYQDWELHRSAIQSPFRRFNFWLRKLLEK